MHAYKIWILVWIAVAFVAESAIEVQLAGDGRAAMPIVVSATAEEMVREAAADLANVLGRMTGAAFSVAEGDGQSGIAVGAREDFTKIGDLGALQTDGLGTQEAYLLRSHADGVWVIGNTALGARHGVWDLLFQLGYRQYFPGEVWEHVPVVPAPSLALDVVEVPDYLVRRIWYGYGSWPENRESDLRWHIRNRTVSSFALNTGHAYDGIISRNKAIFDAHPEYYGLLDGERKSTKLCIGNPEVLALVREDARRQLLRNSRMDSVSVDPSDGGGWCECEACRAIGSASNRALTLANAVSEMLEAEFPERYVAMYAYNEHAPPPTIAARPRVIINAATAFLKGAKVEDYIAGWKAQGVEQFGIREYYGVSTWDRDLPGRPRGSQIAYLRRTVPGFHELGARFLTAESSDNWGVCGLGFYLAGRMLWDVREVDRLDERQEEFLRDCFGEAREPMRQFYRIVGGEEPTQLSRDLVGRLYGCLKEARELAGENRQILARLDHLLLYVRYVELYREYSTNSGQKRQAAFEQVIRHAYRMRRTHMIHSLALYRDLPGRDKSVHVPVEAHWQKAEGTRPEEPGTGLDGMMDELEEAVVERPEPVYNPWKSSEPWERHELEQMLTEGIANNPVVTFDERTWSYDLIPASPLKLEPVRPVSDSVTDRGRRIYYLWVDEAPTTFAVQVQGGLIAHYRDRGDAQLSLYSSKQEEPVATGSSPPDGESREVTLTTPHSGLHRLIVTDGMDRTSVVFPEDVGRVCEFSATQSSSHAGRRYGYFYVPKGVGEIGGFCAASEGQILAPDGTVAHTFTEADYFSIPVPDGEDGKLWRIEGISGRLQLLTVPPFVAEKAETLLLPRDVVERDAPR